MQPAAPPLLAQLTPPPLSLDLSELTTLPLHLSSCTQVHEALKALDSGNASTLPREMLLGLKIGRLVSLLPSGEFLPSRDRSAQRETLAAEMRANCNTRDQLDEEIKDIRGRTAGARALRAISAFFLSRGTRKLNNLCRQAEEATQRIGTINEQMISLDQREAILSRYSESCLGPVAITKHGAYFLKQLDARVPEVAAWPFHAFQRQSQLARRALAASISRMNAIYRGLQQKEKVRRDDRVLDFCLTMALSPLCPQEIALRSSAYLAKLRPLGWRSLSILPALKNLVKLPDGPDTHWNDLLTVGEKLHKDLQSSYASWEAAARILHIPGENLNARMDKFTEVRDALQRNGWKRDIDNYRLAAIIAASPLSAEDSVSRFRALKTIIRKAGGRDAYAAELAAAKLTRQDVSTEGLPERLDLIVKQLAAVGIGPHPGQISLAVELAGVPDLSPSAFATLWACTDLVGRHGMSEANAARDGVKLFRLTRINANRL